MYSSTTSHIPWKPQQLFANIWISIVALLSFMSLEKAHARRPILIKIMHFNFFPSAKSWDVNSVNVLVFAPLGEKIRLLFSRNDHSYYRVLQVLHKSTMFIFMLQSLAAQPWPIERSYEVYIGCCTFAGDALLTLKVCFTLAGIVWTIPKLMSFHEKVYLLAYAISCASEVDPSSQCPYMTEWPLKLLQTIHIFWWSIIFLAIWDFTRLVHSCSWYLLCSNISPTKSVIFACRSLPIVCCTARIWASLRLWFFIQLSILDVRTQWTTRILYSMSI